MKRILLVLTILFPVVTFAQSEKPIRPISVIAGVADTLFIEDYFLTDDPLEFTSSDEVSVEVVHGNRLVLHPSPTFEGLTLVWYHPPDTDSGVIPVQVRRQQEYTFVYSLAAERISVFGQFNDWSRASHPLELQDDGKWQLTVALDPGRYEYKFFVDEEEVLDPTNEDRVANPFGDYNNILTIAPRFEGRIDLYPVGFVDEEIILAFERDGVPAEVRPEDVVVLFDNFVLPARYVRTVGNQVLVWVMPSLDGLIRVAVKDEGRSTRFVPVQVSGGLVDAETSWRDAVIYQIMVDRFLDGDPTNTRPVDHDSLTTRANYHGGDLQGILDKLEEGYFDRLGINALWLSPVVQNTERAEREYPPPHRYFTGYHGYWPTVPDAVDHRFGDIDVLRTLVQEAQQRGIRVLLDFVAAHVHEEHPFFRDHPEWFGELELEDGRLNLRLWDEYRLTTWFEPFLPKFDYEASEEAVEAMTDNAIWWLRESGADGFRHDAVKHIPNNFWRALTQKLDRELDRPVYQIGETFGSHDLIASYISPGQMDAQFNFNLYDAAIHVFIDEGAAFTTLDAEMHRSLDVYGYDHLMGNLMDSHDKSRFLAYADRDILRDGSDNQEIGWQTHIVVDDPESYRLAELHLAYILTTPGIPTIYYGTEIGKTGAADPDNRRPMRFGEEVSEQEYAHKERVVQLIHVRNKLPALRRGTFHTLHADEHTWIYLRADANGNRVVVVLNKGSETVDLPVILPAAFHAERAVDVLTNEELLLSEGEFRMEVSSTGYRILELQ